MVVINMLAAPTVTSPMQFRFKGSGSFHHLSAAGGVVRGPGCSPRAVGSGELILGGKPYASSIVREMAIVGWSAVTTDEPSQRAVEGGPRSTKGVWVGHPESHESQKRPLFIFHQPRPWPMTDVGF